MFPKSVLDQAQYDAGVARRQNPNRNIIQRAQDMIRDALAGGPAPDPSARTPQQQADFDAREAKRIQREQQRTKNINSKTGQLIRSAPGLRLGKGMAASLAVSTAPGAGKATKSKPKTSPLASLGRGDDIPAALYPPGVSTGVGGGNGAQSVQPPTTPTGRDTPAPDGGSGTGTQMSPGAMTMDEANQLLTGGYKVNNPYSSTQLPDTSASPYFGKPDTPQYRSDVPADTYDVQLSTNLTDGSPFNTGDYNYEIPTNTNIEYLQTQGSPIIPVSGKVQAADSKETPVDPKNSGINWGARTAADNSDEKLARRRAFLDAPGSMQGLRRVEAQKEIVYAGGQYNMVNPNKGEEGQNDFVKISKEDRDAYMGGRQTAEQMREKYMQKIADSQQEDGESFTSPPNWKMTPEVEPKTALTQRPAIEVDTSVLTGGVDFEVPDVIFNKGRDKYKK